MVGNAGVAVRFDVATVALLTGAAPARTKRAELGQDGKLASVADQQGSRLPEFSRAGYDGGGVAIPKVDVVAELTAQPQGDDTQRIQQPPTSQDYAIGRTGKLVEGRLKGRRRGHIESHGTPVAPRSLYLQQLADRLGRQAVVNITTEAQRRGVIDDELRRTLSRWPRRHRRCWRNWPGVIRVMRLNVSLRRGCRRKPHRRAISSIEASVLTSSDLACSMRA